MDKIQQMKMRLTPVVSHIQSQVGDAFNLDALAKLFVQVENINAMTPQMTQAMSYAKYIPVKNNFGGVVGTSHILQRKQGVGLGKAYSGTGGDIPLAEVLYDTVSLDIKPGAIGYQYSIHEVATALAMGVSLEADKIAAARLAFEKHMANVAWLGEPETGLNGFYNQTGVSKTAKTIDFENATPTQILDFFNTMIFDALDVSDETGIDIDTIILPTTVSRVLSSRVTSDNNPTLLLDFVKKNNEAVLEGRNIEIVANKRGNGRGDTDADRIVAYRKDPNCIEMRIPQELQFQPAQPKDLDIYVPGSYLYQGVWLKRIDSMRYYDVKK